MAEFERLTDFYRESVNILDKSDAKQSEIVLEPLPYDKNPLDHLNSTTTKTVS
jgi:hypothetical protein